jgi:hypothetical protein
VGAIAHYLEERGLPTTSISLVRENTVLIRPPRALWVPFPLGRPFGAPHEAAFQARVVHDALLLLERSDGPVILEDFPEDSPGQSTDNSMESLVCPVSFPRPSDARDSPLLTRVLNEIASLAPWHEAFVSNHGRSSALVSGLAINDAAKLIATFAETAEPDDAHQDFAVTLRNAAEDLRAWYQEAIASQPGDGLSPAAAAEWFWGETGAGELLLNAYPILSNSDDLRVRQVGLGQWIPRAQKHRFEKAST